MSCTAPRGNSKAIRSSGVARFSTSCLAEQVGGALCGLRPAARLDDRIEDVETGGPEPTREAIEDRLARALLLEADGEVALSERHLAIGERRGGLVGERVERVLRGRPLVEGRRSDHRRARARLVEIEIDRRAP